MANSCIYWDFPEKCGTHIHRTRRETCRAEKRVTHGYSLWFSSNNSRGRWVRNNNCMFETWRKINNLLNVVIKFIGNVIWNVAGNPKQYILSMNIHVYKTGKILYDIKKNEGKFPDHNSNDVSNNYSHRFELTFYCILKHRRSGAVE